MLRWILIGASLLVLLISQSQAAENAETLCREGLDALQASKTDPNAIVVAARKFAAAAAIYEGQGEEKKCVEMNSFLYWCKKKMTSKNMDEFISTPDGAKVASKLEEAAKPVPASEAQAYYDRAEKFAADNATEYFAIAVRYFEVADRFAGTQISLEAQRKSLDAQQLALKTGRAKVVRTQADAPAPGNLPVPDAAALKAAEKLVKETFKEDYAKTKPADKLALAKKLMAQAEEARDDLAAKHVLLREASTLAAQAGDLDASLAAVKKLSAAFAMDVAPLKKSVLAIVSAVARDPELSNATSAMQTLLGKPDNPAANLTAGKYFCFAKGEWETGLPLLAKGSDPALKALAEKELARPEGGEAQAALAEGWCKLAESARGRQKSSISGHAIAWYEQALPALEALSKTKAEKILANLVTPPTLSLDLGGGVAMDMVLIAAGEFDMGSRFGEPCEKPVHKVKISRPFYIGKYEVTVAQFGRFVEATGYQTEAEKTGRCGALKGGRWQEVAGLNWKTPGFPQADNFPACAITWNDAQDFCRWAATTKPGLAVCLPTEAQWEYACRAGTTTTFNTGDKESDLEQAAWLNKNSGMQTHPVGQKKPNAWGLYDMHGNVWEWVQDYFGDKYYAESPPVDPKGPASGGNRVSRGGSWSDGPGNCRAALRGKNDPGHRGVYVGFRVVLNF